MSVLLRSMHALKHIGLFANRAKLQLGLVQLASVALTMVPLSRLTHLVDVVIHNGVSLNSSLLQSISFLIWRHIRELNRREDGSEHLLISSSVITDSHSGEDLNLGWLQSSSSHNPDWNILELVLLQSRSSDVTP